MFRESSRWLAVGAALLLAPIVDARADTAASPQLGRWVEAALNNHPGYQAAQAAAQAAGARLRAADQPLFNPELALEYENTDVSTYTGGIAQTLDWSDKRGARRGLAEFQRQAAQARWRLQRQALSIEILQVLSDWQTADALLAIGERRKTLVGRFAELAERRFQAGDLGEVERDLAYLAAAEADFQLAAASEQKIAATQAITRLTGTAGGDWPRLTESLPALEVTVEAQARLLDAHPESALAQAQVMAARAQIKLRQRDTRPDPTVGLRLGAEGSETLTGLSVSVPLFVRNTFRAEVDVANAELIQAEREAAAGRRALQAGLATTAQVYRLSRAAWQKWAAAGAPRLGARAELLARLWQAGELATTDYLVQLNQSLDTEVTAAEQRGRMWRAWVAWLGASAQVHQWLGLSGES